MSRKYIKQINNLDFVYPNNFTAEYDLEIIHDINDNCVSGNVTTFTATAISSTGITFNIRGDWSLNGAEPYIDIDGGVLSVASIHMMGPSQSYYRPWRLVENISSSNITGTTVTFNKTFTVLPSDLGLTGFTYGTYYSEIRMIGKKCIYPICFPLLVNEPTPTPTPTPTPGGPTITPTPTPTPGGPTITPTPTPTPTIGCATLSWAFTEDNAQGTMDLFVNGSVIESRSTTSSGTYTVCVGDTINVQVYCDQCITSPNLCANAYSLSDKPILVDANCNCEGPASILTSVYTVVSGDIGTTINLGAFASCDVGCV